MNKAIALNESVSENMNEIQAKKKPIANIAKIIGKLTLAGCFVIVADVVAIASYVTPDRVVRRIPVKKDNGPSNG